MSARTGGLETRPAQNS